MKDNKLELRWIVYYYVLIHLWVYCQCALESVYVGKLIDNSINDLIRKYGSTVNHETVFSTTYE